jgi:hypothetical protein
MWSKGEILPSLRRCILAIIVLSAVVWWAFGNAFAQDSAPTLVKTVAHSTLGSLEWPGSNPAPYLVIGMADRQDTPSYGSFGIPEEEATNSSARDTIAREVGPAPSANRTVTIESGPLELSSLLEPTAEVRGPTNF